MAGFIHYYIVTKTMKVNVVPLILQELDYL